MNCAQFRSDLEAAIESHQSLADVDPGVRHHGLACRQASCRQQWDEALQLAELVPAWRSSIPHVDLADRIVNVLRRNPPRNSRVWGGLVATLKPEQTPQEQQPTRRILAVCVSAAATCLLAVSLLRTGHRDSTLIAQSEPTKSSPGSLRTTLGVPGGRDTLSGRRSYVALAQNATEVVTDAMVLVIPTGLADPVEEGEPRHTAAWVKAWERRLQPVGRELSTAVDALLNVVPKPTRSST